MAHDREFQRKRKDTRMPVRDSHGEDQPAARQTEQDFDLRRARDTPSSVNGKTHRQDIPVQTEFSHLSPETPESLLEQGEAYATALDGFSEHFETPDAARTAPPIQDNVRSNFRQEASRRFLVTENATDHDTGKYAPSSEGSATPDSTDRSSQEHRYRTHQHGNKYQQRFQEAAQAEEQAAQKEKGVDSEPPKTSKLEFTADELPPQTEDKKLTHARRKAERTAQKAEQAQNRPPVPILENVENRDVIRKITKRRSRRTRQITGCRLTAWTIPTLTLSVVTAAFFACFPASRAALAYCLFSFCFCHIRAIACFFSSGWSLRACR
jgi:hypothetical protein